MDDLFTLGEDPRRNALRTNGTQNLWRDVTTAEFTCAFTLRVQVVSGGAPADLLNSQVTDVTWDVTYSIASVTRDHTDPTGTFTIKGTRTRSTGYDGGTPVSAKITLHGTRSGSAVPRALGTYNDSFGVSQSYNTDYGTTNFSGSGFVEVYRRADGPELDLTNIPLSDFQADGTRQDRYFELDISDAWPSAIPNYLYPSGVPPYETIEPYTVIVNGSPQNNSFIAFMDRITKSAFTGQDINLPGDFEFIIGPDSEVSVLKYWEDVAGTQYLLSTATVTVSNFTATLTLG